MLLKKMMCLTGLAILLACNLVGCKDKQPAPAPADSAPSQASTEATATEGSDALAGDTNDTHALEGDDAHQTHERFVVPMGAMDVVFETRPRDGLFRSFTMAARPANQAAITSTQTQQQQNGFSSSHSPFAKSDHFVVLIAGLEATDEQPMQQHAAFVYNAGKQSLAVFPFQTSLPKGQSVTDVHRNIVINGRTLWFGSCKTLTPLGQVDLVSGATHVFNLSELQSPTFHRDVVGHLYVTPGGADRPVYLLTNDEPVPVDHLPQDVQEIAQDLSGWMVQ